MNTNQKARMMMKTVNINEIQERLNNATPGAWVSSRREEEIGDSTDVTFRVLAYPWGMQRGPVGICELDRPGDAEFMSHCKQDIAYLLQGVTQLAQEKEDQRTVDPALTRDSTCGECEHCGETGNFTYWCDDNASVIKRGISNVACVKFTAKGATNAG